MDIIIHMYVSMLYKVLSDPTEHDSYIPEPIDQRNFMLGEVKKKLQ